MTPFISLAGAICLRSDTSQGPPWPHAAQTPLPSAKLNLATAQPDAAPILPLFSPPFFLSGGSGSTTQWEDPQHTHPAHPSNPLQIPL